MKYISTRGDAQALDFEEAVLAGLASDGGLYVPEELPKFDAEQIASWSSLSYPELAFEIMHPFIGDTLPVDEQKRLIEETYAEFRHSAIAPLIQMDHELWILELFHGPTLAFKDFALQFLGRLLDYILEKRGQKVVILGATSGDTGSAAIEGCRHCENVDIFILHPHNRVSDVQRRQMTTILEDNVFNLAIEGSFDDCQNIVKAAFADQGFLPEGRQLVAVNSINWARIMAQIVYYFYAGLALGAPAREISFAVPTGNFGDVFAGYLAKNMGLPIERLIIATNSNDILHRSLSANDYSKGELIQSLSPSMDIMISSNYERLLFDLYDRDGAKLKSVMEEFNKGAAIQLPEQALDSARALFSSARIDDEQTIAAIAERFESTGYLMDPHTAIGFEAGQQAQKDVSGPMVCLSTAHPVKFAEAVERSGVDTKADLPHHLKDLMQRAERYKVLHNSLASVQEMIQRSL